MSFYAFVVPLLAKYVLETMLNIIKETLGKAWPMTLRTTWWILRLMLPISLAVQLLSHYGIIAWLAQYLDPAFRLMGLPGSSAIAFLTGAFVSTYAGLSVMLSLSITLRQATILALMICLCHALILESAILRKTGSSFWRMSFIRIVSALVCGYFLNAVLPASNANFATIDTSSTHTLTALMTEWCEGAMRMSIMVFGIIFALMIIQRLMERFGLIELIAKRLAPVMSFFGLPRRTAYMWVVGNVLGISYGSAVMMDMEENGLITRQEANDVNYHLIMNHSMLEDTLVFASMGISATVILATRMLFALALVWGRKLICRF